MTSTAPVSYIRACFMALFDAVEASPTGWDDARWEQFVHVLDETGRLVLGYGSSIIWPETVVEVVADAIGDSVKDLEKLAATLIEAGATRLPTAHYALHWDDAPLPLRPAVVDQPDAEPVSEPLENIPESIPATAPEVDAPPVELTDRADIDGSSDTHSPSTDQNPTSTNDVTAPADAPPRARPKPPAVPLGPSMVRCDPGCGGDFYPAGFAAHRRHCAAYRSHVDANARVVEPRPGAVGPAPDGVDVDVLEAREEADATFAERARAKAADTWARRHPGETSVPRVYGADGLTDRQREILVAVRVSEGNVKAAARALGLANGGGVLSQINALRQSGRLPPDIDVLLTTRRNERLGTKPAVQP